MSPTTPLVSVIVPTKNNQSTIKACLASIAGQSYPKIELIVVDNHSTDTTRDIAKTYTSHVYTQGPERSAQRNFGAEQASGDFLLIIDSDMELAPDVVSSCVSLARAQPDLAAITIPEISFGPGFWTACKALERSFYNGVDWIEAPRFIPAPLYRRVGGYDEAIAGGEDWDLTRKLRAQGAVLRTRAVIRHNEGRIELGKLLRKRFYYARGFTRYYAKGQANKYGDGLRMYALYFSRPLLIVRHPLRWVGMMIMKTAEFVALALGNASASRSNAV